MALIRRHRWLQALLLIGPAALWALAFIVLPTLMAARLSLWRMENFKLVHDWNVDAYREILGGELYRNALVKAARNGLLAALGSVGLSVPLAHFIRFRVRRHRLLFLGAVVIALWLGYLLRIFGWRILLGSGGILNGFLQSAGIVDHPVQALVFSNFAVFLTQTHLAMPFAFIPIYAAMERIPAALLQAGADLGANRTRQFLHVELPLLARGMLVGGTFAFILAFGDFFAPTFVGPPSAQTIGKLAADNFRAIINWPFGAAVGMVMMVAVLLALALSDLLPRLVRGAHRRVAGGA